MFDSQVIVWHGSRGSGKTLSLVIQTIIDMINGHKVWSNFPIVFNYDFGNGSRPLKYEALPLNVDALITQDEDIKGGIVVWDEMPLWVYSRASNAVMNKLVGLIITLLRKKTLSLYVTTQFLSFLDKNVRLQIDAEVYCTDLSFKYRGLERGYAIGQMLKDKSGRFTGEMYDISGVVKQRTFYGKEFWHCYDSYNTFDILKAQQKVKINVGSRLISRDDLINSQTEYINAPADQVRELMMALGNERLSADDVRSYLSSHGIPGNDKVMGRLLKAAGWKKRRTLAGSIYEPDYDAVTLKGR